MVKLPFLAKETFIQQTKQIYKRDKHIKELEEENAILKKAMSIFAKDGK